MRLSRRGLLLGAGTGVVGLHALAEPAPVRLIVVVASGGWDPTFSIDPKPGRVDGPYPDLDPDDPRDVESVVHYGDVRVTLNEARRPGLSSFFDVHGQRVAVVNGLWVGSLSHWQAMVRILTGRTAEEAPDVATLAGVVEGADRPLASVDLSGLSRMGPFAPMCARSGVRGQLTELLDPAARAPQGDGSARPAFAPTAADREATLAWVDGRGAADLGDPVRAAWQLDRREARARAERLRVLGGDLVGDLPTTRRTSLEDDVELAVELLLSETCHAVVLDTAQRWDTHAGAETQHTSTSDTFHGLRRLADRLVEHQLLDRTLVAVVSEMGRAPFRNADDGTDHWPYTSALLFGADVAGGATVGATDDELVGIAGDDGPVRYDQLAAGILETVGVDPGPWLPGVAPLRGFRL